MKTYKECLPCFLRQARDAARIAGADKATESKIVREAENFLPEIKFERSPPEIARTIYGIVDKHTGNENAYGDIKKKSNELAIKLYPRLKKVVEDSEDVLLSAVRLAVAGNVIDYGLSHSFDVEKEIEECLSKNFAIFDFPEFKKALNGARNVLYLLDNAGEIVFDRILIEEMHKSVTCAVRSKPIINDVTVVDADQTGLGDVARVIESGSDIPGTVPGECTDEFLEYYNSSDMIISKGQGNFETLSDEQKDIFFIFKAKCPVVAKHLGCKVGDIILKSQKA